MKYYVIAGEASGDLHAGHLMQAIAQADPNAEFRHIGGDCMAASGGTQVRHYRDLAYMGFVPVLTHLGTIFKAMKACKKDILAWQPDALILVDYPGFNFNIARYIKANTAIPIVYYILPKIWAWKEWRIKGIRRDVDTALSILPFEVDYYREKHHYPVDYVGNPTAEEVHRYQLEHPSSPKETLTALGLDAGTPLIALLPGSRKQEIKDNLPAMLQAASHFPDCQMAIAAAPSIDKSYYDKFLSQTHAQLIPNATYALLSCARAALVTSGTATLEASLFQTPQIVCYKTPVPRLIRWAFNHIIKVKYISLVNLIAGKEVVPELLADRFSTTNITAHLAQILPDGEPRQQMLDGYKAVSLRLGGSQAAQKGAQIIRQRLKEKAPQSAS